jgi:DNA-binding transcriptional LysR family regulator
VTLTPAGEAFYQDTSNLMLYNYAVVERARYRSETCAVVRDLSYTMPIRQMAQIVRQFRKEHPSILMRLSRAHDADLTRQAFFGRNDISLTLGNPANVPEGFVFTRLYQGGFVCVLPQGHPLAKKEKLTIQDLNVDRIFSLRPVMDNPMIGQLNNSLTSWYGMAVLTTVHNSYEAEVLVSSESGIAVMPDFYTPYSPYCEIRPFSYDCQFHIGLYTAIDAPQDVQDFCRIAKEICSTDTEQPVIF